MAPAWRDRRREAHLARNEDDDLTVVPLPASESQAEHDRIRRPNDRDQKLERDGSLRATTEATTRRRTDSKTPEVERVVDE
jgi:hypothetical protein